jgi:DNA-binding transcriptional ArsR family regulator
MLRCMPRPPVHFITTPKAWAVYIAPVRLEIVETMRMVAPCSIAELATATDRPADTLYRHIEKLRKVGVVVEAGVRRSGRRFEQVFDLAGDDFRPQLRDTSPRVVNKMFDDATKSIAKILLRTTRDAAAAEQIIFGPEERNASVKFEHAWLTAAEFVELRELFVGVKRFMDARKGRRERSQSTSRSTSEGSSRGLSSASAREARLYLAAFAAVPVHRRRSARAVAAERSTTPDKSSRGSTRASGKATRRERGDG